MAKEKIIDSKSKKESEEIVITETVERRFTRQDFIAIKKAHQRGLDQCDNKIKAVEAEKVRLNKKIVEIDQYLEELN